MEKGCNVNRLDSVALTEAIHNNQIGSCVIVDKGDRSSEKGMIEAHVQSSKGKQKSPEFESHNSKYKLANKLNLSIKKSKVQSWKEFCIAVEADIWVEDTSL